MYNTIIKIAKHKTTKKIIHIDLAENGKGCNCICLECEADLIAVQGTEREKHFRHDSDSDCKGAQETALHRIAKQIICENSTINLPGIGFIAYNNPNIEKKFDKYFPDVTADYQTNVIFFEIKVNHPIESEKRVFYEKNQYRCVEIDLSNKFFLTYEDIKKAIIDDTCNKELIGWEQNSSGVCFIKIISILFGILLLLFAFGFVKRTKRQNGIFFSK